MKRSTRLTKLSTENSGVPDSTPNPAAQEDNCASRKLAPFTPSLATIVMALTPRFFVLNPKRLEITPGAGEIVVRIKASGDHFFSPVSLIGSYRSLPCVAPLRLGRRSFQVRR
jgi:hypothetical protein